MNGDFSTEAYSVSRARSQFTQIPRGPTAANNRRGHGGECRRKLDTTLMIEWRIGETLIGYRWPRHSQFPVLSDSGQVGHSG